MDPNWERDNWEKNKRQWQEGARNVDSFGRSLYGLLLRGLFYVLVLSFKYVPAVFLVYFAPFLLGAVAYIAHSLATLWYHSLSVGTFSLTPFTVGQVLTLIGHSLGLGFLWLLVIVGVVGSLATIAGGGYIGSWGTRFASAYYVGSLARAIYWWGADGRGDPFFWNIFLVCFFISLLSEGIEALLLWNRREAQ